LDKLCRTLRVVLEEGGEEEALAVFIDFCCIHQASSSLLPSLPISYCTIHQAGPKNQSSRAEEAETQRVPQHLLTPLALT
jgi:hypothetical protein